MVSLSIIIPTRNGAETLPSVLTMLRRQTIPISELLIVDSQSDDASCDIAEKFGARLFSIKKDEFDHGGTRSLIADKAKGDILVFFTQDAVPVSIDAVEKLIAPFETDRDISVTYGRQLPWKDASSSAAHLRSFNYPAVGEVRCFEDRKKLGLKTIFVSNSFAAYRKSSLKLVGYFKDGLIFGEDTCAVGRMLKKGMKIAYVAEAMVYHSHNYSWFQDFKRAFDIGVLHTKENWLVETYGKAEKVGLKYIRSQLNELKKTAGPLTLIDFLGRNACKFFGYRIGEQYRMLPGSLISCMSMHKSWWSEKN
jgi:polysaccharide biosynthesis protein PslC